MLISRVSLSLFFDSTTTSEVSSTTTGVDSITSETHTLSSAKYEEVHKVVYDGGITEDTSIGTVYIKNIGNSLQDSIIDSDEYDDWEPHTDSANHDLRDVHSEEDFLKVGPVLVNYYNDLENWRYPAETYQAFRAYFKNNITSIWYKDGSFKVIPANCNIFITNSVSSES